MPDPDSKRRDLPEGVATRAPDLAGALHEVSNALTVVIGWIERARDAKGSAAELERALEVAGARATLARDIVRRSIGADVPVDGVSTVGSAVDEALLGIEPELRRFDLRVELDLDPDLRDLTIPEGSRVLQILTNLLLNAIAFSPKGGVIAVDARRAEDGAKKAIFGVADEGPGIPEERRATLFESGMSTRHGGAGIGLRHAAALAEVAGGELALASSTVGARLELTWPIGERGKKSAPPPKGRALALDGARVLIVEDDDAVIDLLDMALTARGASVVSVRKRADLPAALATGSFHAALFDISPIQSDVVGALAAAREKNENIRLVVISGSAMSVPSLPIEWVTSWVRKPFEISEIVLAIEGPAHK